MKRSVPVVAVVFLMISGFAVSALADSAARPPSILGTWTGNGLMMDKAGTVSTIPVVLVVSSQKKGLFQGAIEESPEGSFLGFSITGTFANPNLTFSGIDADGLTVFGYGQKVGKTIKLKIYDFKNGVTTVTVKKQGS